MCIGFHIRASENPIKMKPDSDVNYLNEIVIFLFFFWWILLWGNTGQFSLVNIYGSAFLLKLCKCTMDAIRN